MKRKIKSITLNAPAKVNFALEVLIRRIDGYHNIRTIIQTINLFDKVTVRTIKEPHIKLKCFWSDRNNLKPPPQKNLAYRAAVLLRHYFDIKEGVEIILKKRIPAGAGLGGGSSDAAIVLKGLCILWGKKLKKDVLNKIALKIGADVPFFLKGGCCLAEGVGEKIKPLKTEWDEKPLWLVIVKPDFSTSTRQVYSSFDSLKKIKTKSQRTKKNKLPGILKLTDLDFFNDLERVVLKTHPVIGEIKRRLVLSGAYSSLMSGSGSSVFGIFKKKLEALKAVKDLRKLQIKNVHISATILSTTLSMSKGLVM
ncbi:MAG: 4-(cytidine 5'-diphospho)-2-C-methyl-D-erythritol kinase [Elusimicrobiota bacterium]